MSYSDKNRIFFGLLHYIFSEQTNVNWAFKTSLINFTGINENVSQRKYKNDSISNDIIKYVKDVKPYHVQFDHYIEKFTSKDDVANIIASDSLFPTIKVRYDAVSSTPDIEDYIYIESTFVEKDGEIVPDFNYSNLDANIKFYNTDDKLIYRLNEDYFGNRTWVYDSFPIEGKLYYFKKGDYVKIFENRYDPNYKQNILDFYNLTDKQLRLFENTTMANRLFLYKTHDLNLIKDYLNAHYKGLTINDVDFNIDRFGYDAFLYDLKLYEEPAQTIAYCLINNQYNQIDVGTNVIKLNYDEELSKDNIQIIKNHSEEILDYSINNNIITLFENLQANDVIIVIINNTIEQKFITNPFIESNDEKFTKKFFDYTNVDENNNYILDIPNTPIKVNKIRVYLEKPNGYRYPITNYTYLNNKIYLPSSTINSIDKINWKIYISILDYSTIYDKIYTWEDVYGISNNKVAWENYYENMGLVQNLYGNDFLDPHYEKDRPSELSVIYPQDTLFTYISRADYKEPENKGKISFNAKRVFNFDFKNNQSYINVRATSKLLSDFNLGDTEINATKDIFSDPYYENDKLFPGKIILNSEIIEFFEKKKNSNGTVTLKKLKRGTNGTFINKFVEKDTLIYSFSNIKNPEYNVYPSYYFINNPNTTEFIINGDIPDINLLSVYKTNIITLLSDINENTNSFIISDNSINLPIYKNDELISKGYLFIKNTKILFDTITQNNDGTYTISNFNNPFNKTFSYGDSIQSNKYYKLDENQYTLHSDFYNTTKDVRNNKKKNYITLNEKPKLGECIIIENYNKNVFH